MSEFFDRIANGTLRTSLGLSGQCPSTNGQGIGCTHPKGHKGTTHSNQWVATFGAWEDDFEHDRRVMARQVQAHLEPVIQQWRVSEVGTGVGYAVVGLLIELGVIKIPGGEPRGDVGCVCCGATDNLMWHAGDHALAVATVCRPCKFGACEVHVQMPAAVCPVLHVL